MMEKKLLFIKKLEKFVDRKRFYLCVMSLILIAFVLGSCSQQKETQKETNGSSLLFPVMQNGKWGYIDSRVAQGNFTPRPSQIRT
jgi:hypothetical protein